MSRVIDELTLEPGTSELQQLTKQIFAGLENDHDINVEDIRLHFADGIIYLEGNVATLRDRIMAGTLAAQHAPAGMVVNNLNIGYRTDHVLKRISSRYIYFESGISELSAAAKSVLDSIRTDLSSITYNKLVIFGHSDSTGSAGLNARLSFRRAAAARDYLISKGLPLQQVELQALGASRPADGTIRTDRRVHFSVY